MKTLQESMTDWMASADPEPGRQQGHTTHLMLNAPEGSVYVWCNGNLAYPMHLARAIQRIDLQVVGPSAAMDGRLRGI